MPSRPPTYRPPYPTTHQVDRRPTAHQRGYTANWQRARAAFLAANPLCVRCQAEGRLVSANVVDHVIPHRGDMVLFWDAANWQALCNRCHNVKTATEDGAFGHASTPAAVAGRPGGGVG